MADARSRSEVPQLAVSAGTGGFDGCGVQLTDEDGDGIYDVDWGN